MVDDNIRGSRQIGNYLVGHVPPNRKLFGGTVPQNRKLFGTNVLPNSLPQKYNSCFEIHKKIIRSTQMIHY